MHGKLGRGQGEDRPASASVNGRHAEGASEERTDFLGLRGEHDRMNPGNHVVILSGGRQRQANRGYIRALKRIAAISGR
jgi:hypothetical protein